MALVLVGAMLVGSIETVWAGEVTPPRGRAVNRIRYPETGPAAVKLVRGMEMGRFNMGSSVILLYGPGMVEWAPDLQPNQTVQLGQVLGNLKR
jgi:phosphatidylserine decarboxylase